MQTISFASPPLSSVPLLNHFLMSAPENINLTTMKTRERDSGRGGYGHLFLLNEGQGIVLRTERSSTR